MFINVLVTTCKWTDYGVHGLQKHTFQSVIPLYISTMQWMYKILLHIHMNVRMIKFQP